MIFCTALKEPHSFVHFDMNIHVQLQHFSDNIDIEYIA